ncbi:MAG: hypothetical protein GX023_02625 [Tissierellia bacterium]|nr:hypothetical protein [Tissierellia bacterium]
MEKNIFITGITGTMGGEGFKQLLNRQDRFNIISLVRPSNKNKKLLKPYLNNPNIKIILILFNVILDTRPLVP